ncbi:DUF7922 domain-containing protein [Anaerotignum sp. MB30-C6]|uniref:DUF7922 domain-containing protein n=1 Tax=Anaerotignum sp. MB30-C6 TaxID=3070814 RepID=UPI0027DBCCDF|nr:hypothetical protein [Anaerotignum sp. MB30-C6]WMI81555.1 hypothetical protein RBQ60_02130 [Anaerotignum sp. MB30-C6]
MYNRRYDKVFLMLRQETAGYSMGQRAPWGSCVMEIKNGEGRISLTVQSLRPIRRGRYAVYAIAGEGEKQNNFFCGVLTPDAAGHGEIKWDFNPDNLEGKGVAVEKLNTVAILAEADGGFSAPLTAYFGGKIDWRTYFKGESKKKAPQMEVSIRQTPKKEEMNKDVTLVAAEAAVVDMPSFELPKINWKKDAKKEEAKPAKARQESYHGSFRGLLEKFRHELEELQETGVFTDTDMERIERAGRRNIQKEVVAEAINLNVQEEPVEEAIKKTTMESPVEAVKEERIPEEAKAVVEEIPQKYYLLTENKAMYPFGDNAMPWKCISLEETVLLDEIPISWLKDYFFLLSMKKFHHFIWQPEGSGYSLGVPGTDTGDERIKAEELGFQEFKKMDNGDMGYWIFMKK